MSIQSASRDSASRRSRGRWPGPAGHWLTACLRPIQRDPLNFYRQTWETYGDYAEIRVIPGIYCYLMTDPSAVEHVLSKNHKNFRKPARLLMGDGIFVSEGKIWLRQRRLSQPAFLRNRIATYATQVGTALDQFIEEWTGKPDGSTLDVVPEMMRLSLKIASTALLSTDISADADELGSAYRSAFEYVSRRMNSVFMLPPSVPTARNREFRRCRTVLDRVVRELIESRRGATAGHDVLALLLAAQDEDSGTGMSDQQLKDEVITLLTAGHETIGAALSWAWYLLSQNPDDQEALHDEAFARLRGRTPTADDLPHLPFATAVFEETMRLYPPAWGLARETLECDEINGHALRKKATILLSQWVTHRHPAYWSEPDRFRPERFLVGQTDERPKYAYFPFGGGPRACIGNYLAMLEGPLVLAALAQRFQFALVPGSDVIPDAAFTLRPKTAVKVLVRKRR
jgi:cytochrome P450